MDFKLRDNASNHSDEELLDDIRRVAELLKKEKITQNEYVKHGKFPHKNFYRRFGSWNQALKKADFDITVSKTITDKELYDNLEKVWRKIGRQPFYNEMRKPLSKYAVDTYCRRFGGWQKACEKFIEYKQENIIFETGNNKKSTGRSRNISEKLRLKIFKRDNYACVICGRSPATDVGVILHIDHIKPFSKGGDNSMDNLRTLCQKCNLGRNNDEKI